MSSILRISGETLNIEALLSQNVLSPYRIWKKGESRIRNGKIHSDSGACFLASDADFDEFTQQVCEATEYLAVHATAIAKMVSFPGVQHAVLDFGVAIYEGPVCQFTYLPPKLIQLAANVGIGVEVSHYVSSDGKDLI